MNIVEVKKHPILSALIKPTDTDDTIKAAIEIAEMHEYYIGGTTARFATYITESERKTAENKERKPIIRVEKGTVYEQFRFQAALRMARTGRA